MGFSALSHRDKRKTDNDNNQRASKFVEFIFCFLCSVYPEELKVTANISLPHLEMMGDYVVLGNFQMLPVESTGKMVANFCKLLLTLHSIEMHTIIFIKRL